MQRRPVFVPPELKGGTRRVYLAVAVYFIGVFVAMMWPVYPLFSRIRPALLGVPLSLAYLVGLLVLSFLVLLGLFVWEGRREEGRKPAAPGSRDDAGDRKAPERASSSNPGSSPAEGSG